MAFCLALFPIVPSNLTWCSVGKGHRVIGLQGSRVAGQNVGKICRSSSCRRVVGVVQRAVRVVGLLVSVQYHGHPKCSCAFHLTFES